MINCKVELKRYSPKHHLQSVAGNDNGNDPSNNIIFNITNTKSFISVVTCSVKDNQKLSKRHKKVFERSVY